MTTATNSPIDRKLGTMENIFQELETRLETLRQTQESTKALIDKYHTGQLIGFSALANVQVSEPLHLAKDVVAYRVPISISNQIAFVCRFKPKAKLPVHYHDCLEMIQILEGELIDFHTNHELGQTTTYQPMKPHELYSPNGALLMVYFEK